MVLGLDFIIDVVIPLFSMYSSLIQSLNEAPFFLFCVLYEHSGGQPLLFVAGRPPPAIRRGGLSAPGAGSIHSI